jgi:hypothetical protein
MTYRSRWSDGKVHRLWWDSLNKMWRLVCAPDRSYHGEFVDDDTPATCKLCLRGGPNPNNNRKRR